MTTKKAPLTYNDYVKGIQYLRPEDQLSLVEIITAGLRKTLIKKGVKHRITEIEGLGADIWKGTDAQEYVRAEKFLTNDPDLKKVSGIKVLSLGDYLEKKEVSFRRDGNRWRQRLFYQ